jgi:glycosyltransferase involved in cell wall biosynthesis
VPEVVFAIPGDLASPTGGYAYARRLLELLPERGMAVRHLALPGSFPWAPVHDLVLTQALLQDTPEDAVILADGLAYGAMTDLVLRSIDRRIVALVHHPLALETGLNERRRRALIASERASLARATGVVATSPSTARILVADYGVPKERITIAQPGTEPRPRSTGSPPGAPVSLLAVGAVSPRKGYDVLIEALSGIADRSWSLSIAGTLDRDPESVQALRGAIKQAGLADRVTLAGALDDSELDRAYAAADILVHPALFEGYGMVLAEALASGLPIVATTGGAAPETVAEGAGLLVPPGDAQALADALAELIDNPAARARFAQASWAAGQNLPRWSDTADRVADALRKAVA